MQDQRLRLGFYFLLGALFLSKGFASPTRQVVLSNAKEAPYNESRRAFEAFSIVLAGSEGETDLTGGMKSHIVFEKGRVLDQWVPPKNPKLSAQDRTRLFHHDQYTDRISFEMFYGNSDSYDYNMPEVRGSNNSVAKPKVVDYRNDIAEKSATFSIAYDCKRQPFTAEPTDVVISVIAPVVPGISVFFSFLKTCGGGSNPYVEFGFYQDSIDETLGSTRAQFGSKTLNAGPHIMSSRLYLHLHRPAYSQEFFHPKVHTTSPKILTLSTRGPKFGGILRSGESTVIHVLYDCHGKGKAKVSITIGLSPFEPLRATWTKDCGGGDAVHLNIGSSSFENPDIVQSGIVAKTWRVGVNQLSRPNPSKKGTQVISFNTSVFFHDFYFTNNGHPLYLGTPAFTMSHPRILAMYAAEPPSHYTTHYLTGTGGLLETDALKKLRVIFLCKKAGVSQVLITVPVKSFANIEFGFEKKCKAPRKIRHSSFLRTANSFMTLATMLIVACMAYWWYLQIKHDRKSMGITQGGSQSSPFVLVQE